MSPADSTALPERAITFLPMSLATPDMPIAERSPPIVVGMRQTRRAVSARTERLLPVAGPPIIAAKG